MQLNIYALIPFIALTLYPGLSSQANPNPWQMNNALGLPSWLKVSGEHRIRYETLDQQFRASVNGNPGRGGDQALVFRTLFHAKIDLGGLLIGAELEDSRISLADSGSASNSRRLTTSIANPLELLQAYIELPMDDLLVGNSQSLLRAGRITMDIGSRRLVARNRFRNTLNAFTGFDWQWQFKDQQFRAFYTLPVQRLVDGNIRDNHEKFDREHEQIRFWGVYYKQPLFNTRNNAEAFLFGLNENDGRDINTRERDLYTFGWRLWRKPELSALDYQFEGAYQLGESRVSAVSKNTLDHRAHFHHAEIGYSFDTPMSPRLIAQYDFASGDGNPNDNENNRFDTLYGARRFDFGPTSIYGPFIRNNINTPGLRLILNPSKNINTLFSLRGFWRASTNDAWTGANINGKDSYIGTQIETRVRWDIVPKNIRLEGGVAHIFAGDLMASANKKDTTYAYTQAVFTF